uniref:BolA-like protein 2 n=2 Tax=Canis lupus familiaris TaxID=9615 RepID=A0A8C0PKD3_CANLF
MVTAESRLREGGSAEVTDALVRAGGGASAEVASLRAESVAGVEAGVPSRLGCRPFWTAAMELSAEYLREKLQRDLEAEHVEVEDTTPNRCASSFRVLVVSAKFEGKPLLQRHRLVNTCLAEELLHIHAFEQKTLTPEQWARERQK